MPRKAKKLYDYIDRSAIARLAGEPLLSSMPMEGNVSGHHRSNHKGSSVDFAEYREYTPGEDPRRMDWRVLGRTDRYFLKEFEANIGDFKEVQSCYHIAGSFDYLIAVDVPDMDAYHEFISQKLAAMDNIGTVQSSFVMSEVLER